MAKWIWRSQLPDDSTNADFNAPLEKQAQEKTAKLQGSSRSGCARG